MRDYNRPVVLVNEELTEGVYAASGEVSLTWRVESPSIISSTCRVIVPDAPAGSTIRIVMNDGIEHIVVYDGKYISWNRYKRYDIAAIYLVK